MPADFLDRIDDNEPLNGGRHGRDFIDSCAGGFGLSVSRGPRR